jgi:catechol 2,3-dioxygenase-like lactoylglutathione lyase family enzyme
MIAHTSISVRDYKKAKKFYLKTLAPLGYKISMDFPKYKAAGFKEGGHTSFWIGQPKRFAPMHLAFLAKSKKAVQSFYKAALKAGGKDNGGPGFRTQYGPEYYAAFILDRDGNNIEACYFGERAPGM